MPFRPHTRDSVAIRNLAYRNLKLISYEEAIAKIHDAFLSRPVQLSRVRIDKSLGHVSDSTIVSQKDNPERPMSAVDGFGVRSGSTRGATLAKPIVLRIYQNAKYNDRLPPNHAVKLSTGDEIPTGVDAVMKLEEVRIDDGRIEVLRPISKWKNVVRPGENFRKGQVLLKKGDTIAPYHIPLLISAGVRFIQVRAKPRVGILSVGKELGRLGDNARPNKPNDYAYMLYGFALQLGADPVLLEPVKDEPLYLSRVLRNKIRGLDVLITIGRSSVGEKDCLEEALSGLPGCFILFHGIKVLPIKPSGLAFYRGKPICMLPANSVSTALAFFMLAVPILNIIQGLKYDARPIRLVAESASTFTNDKPLDRLFLVQLRAKADKLFAFPLRWGSNLSFELSRATGYVRIEPNKNIFPGDKLHVTVFPRMERFN